MTSTITPTYLTFTEAGSDKFYLIVPLPGGTESLIAYGPRSPNAAGQWSKRALKFATAKEREKLREGYQPAKNSDLPRPALIEMLSQVQRHTGSAASLDPEGNIILGAGSAVPPTTGPKRPKSSKDRVNVWI